MIKKILAWTIILAAAALLLWFAFWCWENARPVAYVLIGVIGGGLSGLIGAVLIWAVEEVTGW